MVSAKPRPQQLISLPPRMAEQVGALAPSFAADWLVASDPPGAKLGSGGGTAHLLVESWQQDGGGASFDAWLQAAPKLMVHAGGQSRRLPAYAACGKAFIPMPVLRWSIGQRLDQTLLELQLPLYQRLLATAAPSHVAMVTAGDVLLRSEGALPALPEADIVVVGLWVTPEQARHHGVLFCPRARPDQLAFVLQKPSADQIREHASTHLFLIDSGVWLLSARAVAVLMGKCGWDAARQSFQGGHAGHYELYAAMGPALGSAPTQVDPDLAGLTSAVVALPEGKFYHCGTSQHLIESVTSLQNLVVDQRALGSIVAKQHPSQHTQNAVIEADLQGSHDTLWIENSHIPSSWTLSRQHVLTGVPVNDWTLALEPGVCLDFVPIGEDAIAVRCYGMADPFRGAVGEASTTWLGKSVRDWFEARQLTLATAGLDESVDIQDAPLFPVGSRAALDGDWLHWLCAAQPVSRPDFVERWRMAERVSATQLAERVDLSQLAVRRRSRTGEVLLPLAENHRRSVFYKLDLKATAELYAASSQALPPGLGDGDDGDPLKRVHDEMFRAAVLQRRGQAGGDQHEARAFERLRELILGELELQGVAPRLTVLEDQIVWGRSPVRLDLAGGWTDTPPYCLQHGGRVLNLAADLNQQPPIQVFARRCETPELVVRSIDLGVEERMRTFEELQRYDQVGSGFTIARAAFALCGFLPRFHDRARYGSLSEQLKAFGGGIEVSLLCAVPKGSGLGTSSILAATLLGTLGDLCGLDWGHNDLFRRTLGLEQMLTTGGGWQDQVGGVLRGVKLIETRPGLDQTPTVRWLPAQLPSAVGTEPTALLYYTGITRTAKQILKEIVRGMFLNSQAHLRILEEIGENANFATDALQRADGALVAEAVRRSWELNQRLDPGTNPPAVQAILDQVGDYLSAAKLLGAGGGGYLLMLAKDPAAAEHIRRSLTANPPNATARFVGLSLSSSGFQVTRS